MEHQVEAHASFWKGVRRLNASSSTMGGLVRRHRHKVYPISSQLTNTFTEDNNIDNAELITDTALCLALPVISCLVRFRVEEETMC